MEEGGIFITLHLSKDFIWSIILKVATWMLYVH